MRIGFVATGHEFRVCICPNVSKRLNVLLLELGAVTFCGGYINDLADSDERVKINLNATFSVSKRRLALHRVTRKMRGVLSTGIICLLAGTVENGE